MARGAAVFFDGGGSGSLIFNSYLVPFLFLVVVLQRRPELRPRAALAPRNVDRPLILIRHAVAAVRRARARDVLEPRRQSLGMIRDDDDGVDGVRRRSPEPVVVVRRIR